MEARGDPQHQDAPAAGYVETRLRNSLAHECSLHRSPRTEAGWGEGCLKPRCVPHAFAEFAEACGGSHLVTRVREDLVSGTNVQTVAMVDCHGYDGSAALSALEAW